MEVESIKYPAIGKSFIDSYAPGSIRMGRKNLYRANIYRPAGTHGIGTIRFEKMEKTRNVSGYTMERGEPTYKFKQPRGFSVRELRDAQKTPLGGSVVRVVEMANTEPYYNYFNASTDAEGVQYVTEVVNGRERRVPAGNYAARRAANYGANPEEDLGAEGDIGDPGNVVVERPLENMPPGSGDGLVDTLAYVMDSMKVSEEVLNKERTQALKALGEQYVEYLKGKELYDFIKNRYDRGEGNPQFMESELRKAMEMIETANRKAISLQQKVKMLNATLGVKNPVIAK